MSRLKAKAPGGNPAMFAIGSGTVRVDSCQKGFVDKVGGFKSRLRVPELDHGSDDLGNGLVGVFDDRVGHWSMW